MKTQDYIAAIVVNASPGAVFSAINNVAAWWAEDITGVTDQLNNVFTVHFGETFVDFKIVQLVPGKKIEWQVTDCYLPWLQDKNEWTNTRVVFDIVAVNNATKLAFTHIGLVPGIECYNGCVKGWDQYFKDSLHRYITEGCGLPQQKKPATA